jgi:hypothetical protein
MCTCAPVHPQKTRKFLGFLDDRASEFTLDKPLVIILNLYLGWPSMTLTSIQVLPKKQIPENSSLQQIFSSLLLVIIALFEVQ